MIDDPRISACMVLYNTPSATVQRSVGCLIRSTERIRLYVVDNSNQDTVQKIIYNMDPSTVFFPQKKNIGYGRANNVVLPHLTSTYHIILNPDITFEPDLVSRMADYMDAHHDIIILSPRVFFPNGEEQHLPHRRPTVRYLLGGPLEKFG